MFEVTLPAQPTKPGGVDRSLQWNNAGVFDGADGSPFPSGLYYGNGSTNQLFWEGINYLGSSDVSFTLGVQSAGQIILSGIGGAHQGSIVTHSNQGLGIVSTAGGASIVLSTNNFNANIAMDGVGNLDLQTVGAGIRVTEGGAGPMQGVAVLVGGSVVVANNQIAANSRIFLTSQIDGGTPGWLRVSARANGVSFTITSSSVLDTSTVAFEIFLPG